MSAFSPEVTPEFVMPAPTLTASQSFTYTGINKFSLTKFNYLPGTGSLKVFVNGLRIKGEDIHELNSSEFSISSSVTLAKGSEIIADYVSDSQVLNQVVEKAGALKCDETVLASSIVQGSSWIYPVSVGITSDDYYHVGVINGDVYSLLDKSLYSVGEQGFVIPMSFEVSATTRFVFVALSFFGIGGVESVTAVSISEPPEVIAWSDWLGNNVDAAIRWLSNRVNWLKVFMFGKVDTIAALRLLDSTALSSVRVLGYLAKGDNGAGTYYLDQDDSSSADNGGTIIVGVDGARWKLDKLVEISVATFGAVSGSTGHSTIFSNAAKAAPSGMHMLYSNFTTDGTAAGWVADGVPNVNPSAQTSFVRVPAGTYVLTSLVDVGNKDLIWIMEPGAIVSNPKYLNGRIVHVGERIHTNSWGIGDHATGHSVTVNTPAEMMAPTLGFPTPSWAGKYKDRDCVGYSSQVHAPALTGTLPSCTFTSTTCTSATGVDTKLLKVGMLIDTAHSIKWSGTLVSWSSDGKTLIVDAWWNTSSYASGTPTNGYACYVNPVTHIWAANTNVLLHTTSHAKSATIQEAACFNWQSNKLLGASPWGNGGYIWGFDSACLNYRGNIAFIAREAWWYGFVSKDLPYSFVSTGTTTKDFVAQDSSGCPHFAVSSSHGGLLELGKNGTTGTPFIGFKSSVYSSESLWDVQLYPSGGNGVIGGGDLHVGAINTIVDNIRPCIDNSFNCGSATYRFATYWGVNGTIQTSDLREKTDVEKLDLEFCKEFIKEVDAITFKRLPTADAEAAFIEEDAYETKKVVVKKEVVSYEIKDGKAYPKVEIQEVEQDEIIFDEYPIVDEKGNQKIKIVKGVEIPEVHKVPRKVKAKRGVSSAQKARVPDRRHLGLGAQHVKEALEKLGVPTSNFGAFIEDEETGRMGIRYEEQLMILWPIVKYLLEKDEKK